MKESVSEHQCVSPTRVKGTLPTSLRDHMVICDHQVAGGDFRIVDIVSNKFVLELKACLAKGINNL